MSFFKDFKADFSQAMNELMPDSNEMYDEDEAVEEVPVTRQEAPKKASRKSEEKKEEKPARAAKTKKQALPKEEPVAVLPEDDDIAPEDLLGQIDDMLEQELYGSEDSLVLPDDMEVNTMDMSVEDLLNQLSEQNEPAQTAVIEESPESQESVSDELSIDDMLSQLEMSLPSGEQADIGEDSSLFAKEMPQEPDTGFAQNVDMGLEALLDSIANSDTKPADEPETEIYQDLPGEQLTMMLSEEPVEKKKAPVQNQVAQANEQEAVVKKPEKPAAAKAVQKPAEPEKKETEEKQAEKATAAKPADKPIQPVVKKAAASQPEKPVLEETAAAKAAAAVSEKALAPMEKTPEQVSAEESVLDDLLNKISSKEVPSDIENTNTNFGIPEKVDESGKNAGIRVEPEAEKKQERTESGLNEVEPAVMKKETKAAVNKNTIEQKETIMSEEKDVISINAVEEEVAPAPAVEAAAPEIEFNVEDADDATTYITRGTKITGDLETDGSIDIIGKVEGNIICKGKVVVGGQVVGGITAGELYANNARVEGDVKSYGSVKIGVGSVIVGGIVGESAVIAGAVNGDIDVKGPVIVDSTAVIMGNIKSRSVQINNGAVIEGFCSQSYSDIDVKSFFA